MADEQQTTQEPTPTTEPTPTQATAPPEPEQPAAAAEQPTQSPPPAAAPGSDEQQLHAAVDRAIDDNVLDLTGEAVERATVRLPEGDFKMRTADELTFEQFAMQMRIGRELVEMSQKVAEPGVLEETQRKVIKAAHIILLDLTDEAANNLTPGQFLKINNFFNKLARADRAPASATGTTPAPGVSGSTEVPPAI